MPLRVHGHYSRAEIETTFGVLTDEAPWIRREGVLWHDLALGPALFHWESQSSTTAASPTEPFVCLGFARYEGTRVNGSCSSTSGDSLAAGTRDPGGVADRLLLGIKVALAV